MFPVQERWNNLLNYNFFKSLSKDHEERCLLFQVLTYYFINEQKQSLCKFSFSVTVPCNFLERDFGFCSLHKWNKFEKKKNFHKQFKQDITGGRKNNILRAKKVLQQTIIRANYPQHLYSWDESIPAFPMTVIQEIYCRQIVSNRARPCLQGDG